ncbi:hypothetical protein K449DRAFT_436422 [Hypoxylon sp. EC38]|nr:hypothetical protein K449DRAFT_436422 [Hypoxylon sp. EC38]
MDLLVSSRPVGVDFPPPPAVEEDGRPTKVAAAMGMGKQSPPPSSTETTAELPSPFTKGRHHPGALPPRADDTRHGKKYFSAPISSPNSAKVQGPTGNHCSTAPKCQLGATTSGLTRD